jgi:hypothetical protein
MKFTQYIASFIAAELAKQDIFPFEFEFSNLNDFLENPHMKFYSNDNNFKRFSACRDNEIEIIVELKDGHAFKLGTIDQDLPGIPEWEFHKKGESK